MANDRLTRNAKRRAVELGRVNVRSGGAPTAIVRPIKSGGTTEYRVRGP